VLVWHDLAKAVHMLESLVLSKIKVLRSPYHPFDPSTFNEIRKEDLATPQLVSGYPHPSQPAGPNLISRSFFFFFLICLYKMREGRFELMTSAL
jgi:hypothetical protein